jgi:hypothetical protein
VKAVRAAGGVRVALVAMVVVALTGAVASADWHWRRPGCSRSCRQLGARAATTGACLQHAFYLGSADVSDSKLLKMKIRTEHPSTGDLMLAVVRSRHGVKPPRGWSANSRAFSTYAGRSQTVQVFYRFAGRRVARSYSFTSSTPQQISGALLDAQGVSQRQPFDQQSGSVSAGPPSRSVTADSITPTSSHSLILFIGAVQQSVRWTAPRGMTAIHLDPAGTQSAGRLGIAMQRWRLAASTGDRRATISAPSQGFGELIALRRRSARGGVTKNC